MIHSHVFVAEQGWDDRTCRICGLLRGGDMHISGTIGEEVAPRPEERSWEENLKDLYGQITKMVHPDRATNEADRQRRKMLIKKANLAYGNEDVKTLFNMLSGL